jgi:hypothetical protein
MRMKQPDDVSKLLVRLPGDMRQWLQLEAERNVSSQNIEVIRSVRIRMDQERREKVAG